MRKKTIAILVLAAAVSLANLCLPLEAKTKFAITDIEYLKGDDFVQLHFVTNAIIPIPDLFYPKEDNPTIIVMKIPNVDFVIPKDRFKFDSPVIDNVRLIKKEKFVNVRIKLKDRVNYRVFTNQEGLFIEFPKFKKIAANKGKKSKHNIPLVKNKPTPKSKKQKKAAASVPPVSVAVRQSSGSQVIKNFQLSEKNNNRVKFEFALSGPVDYNVIPVLEGPVRLAIDLKNTRAKRFNRDINCLNVKGLRGAFNSPTVFRVVFDLLYLKNYNVSFNNDKNVLVVEFFNTIDHLARQSPKKEKKAGIKPAKMDQKNTFLAQNQANQVKDNNNNNITNETIEDVTPRGPIKVSKSTPQPQDDFFAEEKSQVSQISKRTREKLNKIDKAAQERGRWIEGIDDQEGGSQEGTEEGEKTFLLQTISGGEARYQGEPMDFDFKNADLENVILFFAKISGLSIVIDPGVTGTITARMYQVPWDQALEYFLKVNGLDMVREGNLLRIGKVDVLAREAQARRRLRESRQMEGELETFTRTLSYAQASQLAPILTKQLSQRGYILQDKRSNTLIISEVPEKKELLDKLINTLDTANPQVSIEARIVETNSNYTKSLGIQWGYGFTADAMYGNQTSLKFPNSVFVGGNQIASTSPFVGPLGGYAVNLPAPGPSSGTVFSLANVANTFRLDMALSAMQAQGKGRIISAPKTTTQNNMEATIQQGKSIPVQTSQNNTIQVRYVPAALELKVTPQITAKGTVIVDVDIKNNAPDFANLVLGIPPITTQTIKTTIMVDDGGTIVIGGMYRVEDASSADSVPFFSKIPLLGNLFKNSNRRSEQKELLIFITPRIIK